MENISISSVIYLITLLVFIVFAYKNVLHSDSFRKEFLRNLLIYAIIILVISIIYSILYK